MSSHITYNFHQAASVSASDGTPDVFGSVKSENVWQLDPEGDRTLLCLGCQDKDSLEESLGHTSTIKVSVINECEGSSLRLQHWLVLGDCSSLSRKWWQSFRSNQTSFVVLTFQLSMAFRIETEPSVVPWESLGLLETFMPPKVST